MYIVHVPCFVSIILWYHWCEKKTNKKNGFAYSHCIIWSEQGHIFYILSLLRGDDAVIRFKKNFLTKEEKYNKKKTALKYSSMSKSDVGFRFVNIIHWYYPFLSVPHVKFVLLKEKKNNKNNKNEDTHSRYLVPFVKPCWYCDSAAHERGCAASRLKDAGNIFVTECKSYSEGGTRWTS